MIKLYSGTPGSGKSLKAAKLVYDSVKKDKLVITNFAINTQYMKLKHPERLIQKQNYEITPDFLKQLALSYFADKKKVTEGKLILIFDEAELFFNSRDWQRADRREWLSFFALHRHFGYDIILIAQYDRMLDRQIRALIEHQYVCRKVSNVGAAGKFFSILAGGSLHIVVDFWYPMKERCGVEYFKGKKKYYRIYDTYLHFKLEQQQAEETAASEPETELENDIAVESESQQDDQQEEAAADEQPDDQEETELQSPKKLDFTAYLQKLSKTINDFYLRIRFMRK